MLGNSTGRITLRRAAVSSVHNYHLNSIVMAQAEDPLRKSSSPRSTLLGILFGLRVEM